MLPDSSYGNTTILNGNVIPDSQQCDVEQANVGITKFTEGVWILSEKGVDRVFRLGDHLVFLAEFLRQR